MRQHRNIRRNQMTKCESMRRFNLDRYLILSLGFTADEVAALRRISMTLRRWHELECGNDHGVIERDEATGKPYWVNYHSRYLSANDPRSRSRIADREAGALRRLQKIMANHAPLTTYIQTDPRGAALYILRPGDIPAGYRADSCYTNGVCVY
jgi:hypothetical protein